MYLLRHWVLLDPGMRLPRAPHPKSKTEGGAVQSSSSPRSAACSRGGRRATGHQGPGASLPGGLGEGGRQAWAWGAWAWAP